MYTDRACLLHFLCAFWELINNINFQEMVLELQETRRRQNKIYKINELK